MEMLNLYHMLGSINFKCTKKDLSRGFNLLKDDFIQNGVNWLKDMMEFYDHEETIR